jgi:hypothetical protein
MAPQGQTDHVRVSSADQSVFRQLEEGARRRRLEEQKLFETCLDPSPGGSSRRRDGPAVSQEDVLP